MCLGIVGAAIAAYSAYSASEGQKDANEANRDIANQNTAQNMAEAQNNRDFQERMSNTSYQRGVEDMKAAGLNPMLSYSKGGATAPAGGQGQAVSPAPMQNTAPDFGRVLSAAQQYAQIENTEAQTENVKWQTENTKTQLIDKETGQVGAGKYNSFQAANTNALTELYGSQSRQANANINKILEDTKLSTAQREKVKAEIINVLRMGPKIDAETGWIKIKTILDQNGIPETAAYRDFFKSSLGRAKPATDFGVSTVGSVLNSAGTARRLGGRTTTRSTSQENLPDGFNRHETIRER